MPKTKRSRVAQEVDVLLRSPGSGLSDVVAARHRETEPRDLGPLLGTTTSGKAIYQHAVSGGYAGFTRQDHLDAADLHRDFAAENRMNYKFNAHHKRAAEHERRARLL